MKGRFERCAENARVLRDALTRPGLEILVPEAGRSNNILTTFRLPAGHRLRRAP